MLTIDMLKRIKSILESMLYISNGSRTGNSLIHEHAFSEPHLTEKKGMQVQMFTPTVQDAAWQYCAGATRML